MLNRWFLTCRVCSVLLKGASAAAVTLTVAGALSSMCAAQDLPASSKGSNTLRNPGAVSHVEELFQARIQSKGTSRILSSLGRGNSDVNDQLRVETVDGLLQRNMQDNYEYTSYRDLALQSYTDDRVNVNAYEYEQGQAAEKVFLFETLRVSNQFVFKPALGQMYDSIVEELKTLRNYTTFGVIKQENGGLRVQQGISEDQRVVEFKIHASARYGLEPRLKFSDRLMLRYQVLDSTALLEYRYDF